MTEQVCYLCEQEYSPFDEPAVDMYTVHMSFANKDTTMHVACIIEQLKKLKDCD